MTAVGLLGLQNKACDPLQEWLWGQRSLTASVLLTASCSHTKKHGFKCGLDDVQAHCSSHAKEKGMTHHAHVEKYELLNESFTK